MYTELLETALAMSDAELDAHVRDLELAERELHARRAAALAVTQHRGSYRDGHRSINAYLRATCNISTNEAGRRRLIAEVCSAIPALGDALAFGRVGEVQIAEIARIHSNPRTREYFSRVAPIYVEKAEHSSFAELHTSVTSFLNLADQDGAFTDLLSNLEHRTASVNVVGGTLDVRASGGDPLVADEVMAIFEWFVEREFAADVDARRAEHGDHAAEFPLPRSDRHRRFDALVAMARAVAAHGDGANPADITVNVVTDPETLDEALTGAGIIGESDDEVVTADFDDETIDEIVDTAIADADDPARWIDRRCETSRGTPIHPVLLLRAAMRGHVRRVIIDSHGVVINWGRRRRLFTGPARQAAQLLARRCTHPGCTVPADLADIDHNAEWCRDLGPTDQRNANIACRTHNRFKSRTRWQVARDDTGRPFHIRPDGTVVLPVGARPPSFALDDTVRHLTTNGYHVIRVAAAA